MDVKGAEYRRKSSCAEVSLRTRIHRGTNEERESNSRYANLREISIKQLYTEPPLFTGHGDAVRANPNPIVRINARNCTSRRY